MLLVYAALLGGDNSKLRETPGRMIPMVSHKHRCIFVHIPRTGGSSIEDVIWPGARTTADLWMGFVSAHRNRYQTGGLQHLFARHIRQEVGDEVFRSYFKFTVVRNPWDKTVSQFAFMRQRPDLRRLIGMTPDSSLAEYLDLICPVDHVQWESQTEFLRDESAGCVVDFVARFETLADDVRFILGRLGIDARLPHSRSSVHRHYSEYFDRETRERVAILYRKDIETFGYEFEPSA